MGKIKVHVGLFYLIGDILTKVLQKCSLSSPQCLMKFVQSDDFDLWQNRSKY